MTVYRYAFDRSGRTFTEHDWIGQAWPHFIKASYDTDGTFYFFLCSVWALRIAEGSIVEATYEGDDKIRPFQAIGCPKCDRRHVTNENGSFPNPTDHSPWSAAHYRIWALKE